MSQDTDKKDRDGKRRFLDRKVISWDNETEAETLEVVYAIDDAPPWYLAILLGLQHYLTMVGASISIPYVLSASLCITDNPLALSKLISSIFFVSGIVTLTQATIGVRLPIVQGGTFSFITPTIAILSLFGECTSDSDWKERIVEVQGAIMVSSAFQIVFGLTGGIGFLLRFIGPLTVTPAISLVGISLFDAASFYGSANWGLTAFGVVCITTFSQILSRLALCEFKLFKLFPVILGMSVSWLLCLVMTETGVITDDSTKDGFRARTDRSSDVIQDSDWFRVPYPCQWGTPKVTAAGVFGMLAGVLAGMVESVGDYFACARLSGAPVPTVAALNRGVLIEGLGCFLAGLIGTGNGTTSYSENIGAIGITKVGSRRVIVFGSLIMILIGCFSKFGAIFATIPDPVIAANFFCMFGMITAVGLSNLQFVNLNSSRNLYILGFSIFTGISLPKWVAANPGCIDTGNDEIDQIIEVLLSTSMFIGGFLGCFLDNVVPGNAEDRGIKKWRQETMASEASIASASQKDSTYDIPFVTKYLNRWKLTKYIPICPAFMRDQTLKKADEIENNVVPNYEDTVFGEQNGFKPVESRTPEGVQRSASGRSLPYRVTSL